MNEIYMCSYNVRGIRDSLKRRKIFNFLHDHSFNVILLQETHSIPNLEGYWRAKWGGKIYFSHGTTAAKGCAIMFTKNFKPTIHDVIRDPQGRYIIMKIQIEKLNVTICCCYAPNEDDPKFF